MVPFLNTFGYEKKDKKLFLEINTYSSDLLEKVVVMVVLIRESKPWNTEVFFFFFLIHLIMTVKLMFGEFHSEILIH